MRQNSKKADPRIETEAQRRADFREGVVLLSLKMAFFISSLLSCCLYLVVKQIKSNVNSLFICKQSRTFI